MITMEPREPCKFCGVEEKLAMEQHRQLLGLKEKLAEVLDHEPLDSGDEEEAFIWENANVLRDLLEAFFEEDGK